MCGRNFFFYSNSRQVASVSTLYCDIVYLLVVNKFLSLSLFLSGNPIGKRSIVMSVSVCLSVCVPVCLYVRNHIFITTSPIFTKNFVHVTYGRGSVLLWRIVICYVLPVLWMTSYSLINHGCSTSPPS